MIDDAIEGLERELQDASAWDKASLTKKIFDTRFHCKRCGKCCKGQWGDNTVTVFPGEVRGIMRATGLEWLEIVRPMESDDADASGEYHTFEWALQKQKNGDCKFLRNGACAIYASRPLICRTYPMRLESGELETYDCDGIGTGVMGAAEADEMAETLHERQLREARETLSLLRQFKPFDVAPASTAPDRIYMVHDSEGSRRVFARRDGSYKFL